MRKITGTILTGIFLAGLAVGCGSPPTTLKAGDKTVEVHSGANTNKKIPDLPPPPPPPP